MHKGWNMIAEHELSEWNKNKEGFPSAENNKYFIIHNTYTSNILLQATFFSYLPRAYNNVTIAI